MSLKIKDIGDLKDDLLNLIIAQNHASDCDVSERHFDMGDAISRYQMSYNIDTQQIKFNTFKTKCDKQLSEVVKAITNHCDGLKLNAITGVYVRT